MAEISKILVLSTAHLTPATLAFLNETPKELWPGVMDPISYGFIIWADQERSDGLSDDIWAICQRAKQLGCRYVKLDCDAETIDTLPTYDHG